MNHHNRSHLTARIVLAVAFLGAGIASAQTRPTLELPSASAPRAVTPANTNRSSAFQTLNIDRPALRPLDVKRVDMLSGSSQPRVVNVADWPIAPLVKVTLTEPTTIWMPSGLDGVSRSNFTNVGVYDR